MSDFKTRLTRAASGFLYVFRGEDPSTGVEYFRFEASRLQATRGGMLADVTVFSNIETARVVPGSESKYVVRQVIDLLSARSKHDFGQLLNERIPAPAGAAAIGWATVIEEFSMSTLDALYAKPKVLDLSTVTPEFNVPYLVPYLLPKWHPTILYGAGGTGKSIFAASLAAAVQTGSDFIGWTCDQTNVLYLDWETEEGDMARRNALASAGLGLTSAAPVRYMRPGGPITDHAVLMAVAEVVAQEHIGLVVVDSVEMATESKGEKSDPNEKPKSYFAAMKMLDVTSVSIDHLSGEDMKQRKGVSSKPYGSVFKWNIARNIFELLDVSEGPDTTLLLKHRKSNVGLKSRDLTLGMTWAAIGDGGVRFRQDLARSSAYSQPLPGRVLTVLDAAGTALDMRSLESSLGTMPGYDPVTDIDILNAVRDLQRQRLVYHDPKTGLIHKTVLTPPPSTT